MGTLHSHIIPYDSRRQRNVIGAGLDRRRKRMRECAEKARLKLVEWKHEPPKNTIMAETYKTHAIRAFERAHAGEMGIIPVMES